MLAAAVSLVRLGLLPGLLLPPPLLLFLLLLPLLLPLLLLQMNIDAVCEYGRQAALLLDDSFDAYLLPCACSYSPGSS